MLMYLRMFMLILINEKELRILQQNLFVYKYLIQAVFIEIEQIEI